MAGVCVGECFFVFPLCGFSLSLFCNYPVPPIRYSWAAEGREGRLGAALTGYDALLVDVFTQDKPGCLLESTLVLTRRLHTW